MRADRPLVAAVIFLGVGLGSIIAYCHGTTGFNAAYPLSGSSLHIELTTIGPAVIGGMACLAIGVLFLIWAFLVGVATMFTGSDRLRERNIERYEEPSFETRDYPASILPREPRERTHGL